MEEGWKKERKRGWRRDGRRNGEEDGGGMDRDGLSFL